MQQLSELGISPVGSDDRQTELFGLEQAVGYSGNIVGSDRIYLVHNLLGSGYALLKHFLAGQPSRLPCVGRPLLRGSDGDLD